MDASPLLLPLIDALHECKLECILVGNAAAALQGTPVTTLDFDFMFRETPANMRKLKAASRKLNAVILRPYYPISKLYRLVNEPRGLQADFMPVLHGITSFESLRSRAVVLELSKREVVVAALADIIKSKPRQPAPRISRCSPSSNRHFMKSKALAAKKRVRRQEVLDALRDESERQLRDLIRRRLALPVEKRTNFLRVRLPGGGSCL